MKSGYAFINITERDRLEEEPDRTLDEVAYYGRVNYIVGYLLGVYCCATELGSRKPFCTSAYLP